VGQRRVGGAGAKRGEGAGRAREEEEDGGCVREKE